MSEKGRNEGLGRADKRGKQERGKERKQERKMSKTQAKEKLKPKGDNEKPKFEEKGVKSRIAAEDPETKRKETSGKEEKNKASQHLTHRIRNQPSIQRSIPIFHPLIDQGFELFLDEGGHCFAVLPFFFSFLFLSCLVSSCRVEFFDSVCWVFRSS